MSRIVRIVDLACGAGLGARGLIDELNHLGFTARVVFACDTWGPAIESYERNVPEAKGGVHQVPVDEAVRRGLIPPSDLLIAGPPCIRDSTLTACRSDVADRSLEMADIKEGVLGVARQTARRFAIETNRGWDAWGVAHGVLFQAACMMIYWSYLAAATTDPGTVARGTAAEGDAVPPVEDPERMWKPHRKLCRTCECIKPTRAHHCKTCNRCVMKMGA